MHGGLSLSPSKTGGRAGGPGASYYDSPRNAGKFFGSSSLWHSLCSTVYFVPIHVLHESVHVFGSGCSIIHVIRMLVHVEDQQRIAQGRAVHVIPGPVVVNFPSVQIASKNHPARSAAERVPRLFELRLPLFITAEPFLDQIDHFAAGSAISAKIREVVIVQHDRPGADQFFAFEVAVDIRWQILVL